MSQKPSKPETRIEDYLDVMTGGNAALPQPILRIEFYYAFLAGMTVELPQPILDDEKLLAKICGMEVLAPTYIPGISPRLYAYMAKKGGQDVQVPDPILRIERYWYDYSAGSPPSVQEYTGALPVTFVADGTPLLDLLISGNEEHSGTPTPENPVMPQGTGDKTANLLDISLITSNSGIINNGDGTLTVSGYPVNADQTLRQMCPDLKIGDIVYLRFYTTGLAAVYMRYYESSALKWSDTWGVGSSRTMTEEYLNARVGFYKQSSAQGGGDATISNLMICKESSIPYEPYGIKIPISSANTTTPVYLGEVQTTRKIKKLVLTGSEDENWNTTTIGINDYIYRMELSDLPKSGVAPICTHYTGSTASRWVDIANYEVTTSILNSVAIRHSGLTGVSDWKTYLQQQYAAGTPVTVWYVLATEQTAVVNEPIMKIGEYADTLSMEQAGVQIPTANGSTTLDVETTVKPSEIYIKYRGEAVTTLSSLPAEVSSPEAATEEVNPEETEEEENER